MKTCPTCGTTVNDTVTLCPTCNTPLYASQPTVIMNGSMPQPAPYREPDAPNGGMAFLSFLFPFLGFIFFLVWKAEYPLKAKSCLKGSLIAIILYVVACVLGGLGIAAFLFLPALLA